MPMTDEAILQLTKGLAITAICVGSIIVGKKYYDTCDIKNLSNSVNSDNTISHQDRDIKRLVSFIKADNAFIYNFEENTHLNMKKNDKTIGMANSELNKIAELK